MQNKNDLISIPFILFLENTTEKDDKNINLSEEDVKFLIDKSIIKIFGSLEACKVLYSVKKEQFSLNKFTMKLYNR
jgi:hypothetical protein